jgi:SagB-type dehydrogenase family enzyme
MMNKLKGTNKTTDLLMGSSSISVKLRADITTERLGNGKIALSGNLRSPLEAPATPLMERLMTAWLSEEDIDRLAEEAANPPAVYFLCAKLFSLGLLHAQCSVDGQSLFSLIPAPDWNAWRGFIPAGLGRLSRHACLRRVGSDFVLEMALSQRKCLIHDEHCLVWMMESIRGGISLPAEDAARTAFYRALWLMDALEQEEPTHAAWEFHDLLFYHHSSFGFHDDPIGATWRLKDTLPPAPLFKPCSGECVSLPEPDRQLMEKLRAPFAEVIAHRRSGRIPGIRPITLEEIGALLHVSARVQDILDDPAYPCPASLRPSPSGGALHSLEIYPMVHECAGLDPGAWRYDPAQHRLESVAANDALVVSYLKSNPHDLIQDAGPPNIRLVITSRFLRNSWKYEKIAYRLVLQDLGCLYQTMSLAATALGLATCILGAVDARRLSAILKIEPLVEPVIGEMTLSSR